MLVTRRMLADWKVRKPWKTSTHPNTLSGSGAGRKTRPRRALSNGNKVSALVPFIC